MLNTSEAQLNLISTLDPAEDLSSNLDLSVGDLSNSENLFLSNDQSFSGPDSEFLTGNTNPNSDGSLLGTSPGSNILDSNDEASFAFLTATGESCSLDPSSKVKRQNGEACLPGVENPASLLENYQLQPGVLTPELIKKMIRTIPYGIALSLASDYTWCDPTNQRNYAVCDSGFSYDRIPLPTPPFYDLFDCSQYLLNNAVCKSPHKVWCCEMYWFSINPLETDRPEIATNCLQLLDPEAFEIPRWMQQRPF